MSTAEFPVDCWLLFNITAIICIKRSCPKFFKTHVATSHLLFRVANFYCMNYCFTNISIIFSGLLEKIFLILIYYIYFIILVNWSLTFVVSETFLQLLNTFYMLFIHFSTLLNDFFLFFIVFFFVFTVFLMFFHGF